MLLTPGRIVHGKNVGIEPKFLLSVFDRRTGEDLRPLWTPPTDQYGKIRGAKIVAETIVTADEAEKIQ